MEIAWDEAKSNWTRAVRGFGFDVASLIFEGRTIEVEDTRFDYGETRIQAIGEVDGVVLFVVFVDAGSVRRIISARRANRKERVRWRER